MKSSLPLVVLSCLFALPVGAQTNADTNTSPNQQMQPPPPPRGPMANLTKEERDKLKNAHDKAIQQDPSLDQKMKAAFEGMKAANQALQDAMIKVDPSVQLILEKIAPPKCKLDKLDHPKWASNGPKKWQNDDKGGTNSQVANSTLPKPFGHDGPGLPPGFANLTADEQAQLKAAHEKVKDDPAVIAAKEAEKNAATPEQRRSAREAVHKAMHDAMLHADPSLGPILEKIRPSSPPPQSPGGAEGQMKEPPQ